MVFYNINTVPVDKDTFDGTMKFCDDNALAYCISRRNDKSHNYYHYINVNNDVLMVVILKKLLTK